MQTIHSLAVLILCLAALAVAVPVPEPGWKSHEHYVFHVPYKVKHIHHHHVKKVPVYIKSTGWKPSVWSTGWSAGTGWEGSHADWTSWPVHGWGW